MLSPPSPLLSLFFFHSFVALRDLPSFPTRRSSDLTPWFSGSPLLPSGRASIVAVKILHSGAAPDALSFSNEGSSRSEEHTSELQSQFHLVCRLLLEKKKKNSEQAHLSVM